MKKKGFNQHISSLSSHMSSVVFPFSPVNRLLVVLDVQSKEIMTVMFV